MTATTKTNPAETWAVTGLRHPGVRDYSEDCLSCLALVESAIADATVTGSYGATHTETGPDSEHSATVNRTFAVVKREPAPAPVVFDGPVVTRLTAQTSAWWDLYHAADAANDADSNGGNGDLSISLDKNGRGETMVAFKVGEGMWTAHRPVNR